MGSSEPTNDLVRPYFFQIPLGYEKKYFQFFFSGKDVRGILLKFLKEIGVSLWSSDCGQMPWPLGKS